MYLFYFIYLIFCHTPLYGEIFGDLPSFLSTLLPLLFLKYDFVYRLVDNIVLSNVYRYHFTVYLNQ